MEENLGSDMEGNRKGNRERNMESDMERNVADDTERDLGKKTQEADREELREGDAGSGEQLRCAGKHFSRLGWMLMLGTLIIYAAQLIPMNIIAAVKPEWLENPDISLLASVLPLYLIGMPVMVLLLKRIPAETVEKHTMKAGHFVLAAILCFGLVYSSNIAGNIVTILVGLLKGSAVENVIAGVATSVSTVLVLLYMVLAAPFVEEYVFRKLLVDRTIRYGQGVAVVVSGLVFGLFHGNLNQFVYAFVLGAFLAFLYAKTGKLRITIALHMMINFVGGFVSVQVLELIDLEAYQNALLSSDHTALAAYFTENLVPWLIYGLYLLFIVGMLVAGIVLLIVFLAKKRFTFAPGQVMIPAGKRFRTVILNPGMLVYCLFWLAVILWQLLA